MFLRADLNAPMDQGAVADDTRLAAVVPTIRHILEARGSVVLASHLGRPKGAARTHVFTQARGGAAGGLARAPRAPGPGLRRPGGRGDGPAPSSPGDPAPREPSLPRRGGGQRRRLREGPGRSGRLLRQRCLCRGSPRPCFHRRHHPPPQAGGGRPAHAGRAGGAGPHPRIAGASPGGVAGRGQGVRQAHAGGKPPRAGRRAPRRRGHGVHVPPRASGTTWADRWWRPTASRPRAGCSSRRAVRGRGSCSPWTPWWPRGWTAPPGAWLGSGRFPRLRWGSTSVPRPSSASRRP